MHEMKSFRDAADKEKNAKDGEITFLRGKLASMSEHFGKLEEQLVSKELSNQDQKKEIER